MKKQMSLFVWAAAVFGMSNVWAAGNADYNGYKSSYVQPQNRTQLYKNYTGSNTTTVRKTTSANTYGVNNSDYSASKRKYYLAHPFFQPTKGKFGSVTDLSYAGSSYDVKITPFEGNSISDPNASWDATQMSVKEDLSYGISERVAIVGSARYASSDYKMDWALPETVDDKNSDSGIDVYGLGLQWRFVDTNDWIATASAYYQNIKDIADGFILNAGAGYKVGKTTWYGLARLWSLNLEGNSYGDGITDTAGNQTFLAYKTNTSSATYIEAGFGMFSVLDKDWTLNMELSMGNYDWHNQGAFKAAIGWQPNESFALNLYGKTTIYDSADGKDLGFWYYDAAGAAWGQLGTAKVSGYNEMSVGLQAILYF